MTRQHGILASFLTLLVLLNCRVLAGELDRFESANRAYEAGKFEEASHLWQDLAIEGFSGLELYYNIGNAQFRLGNLGEAVLFWERAALHAPFDRDVQKNLQVAAELRSDRLEEPLRLPFWNWLDRLLWSLSPDSLAWSLLFFVVLFVVSLSIRLLRIKISTRPIFDWLMWSGALAGLLMLVVLSLQIQVRERTRQVVILSDEVHLRAAPLTDAEALFDLHEGTVVGLRKEGTGWLSLRLPDGREGWCPTDAAAIIVP